jgi:thiol-disulfide isomerase/thioredoxin
MRHRRDSDECGGPPAAAATRLPFSATSVIEHERMHGSLRAAPWIFVALAACSRDDGASRSRTDSQREDSVMTAQQVRVRVRDLRAKVVLVNAWATWCDSCEHELPMLQQLADRLAPQSVRVLLVSVNEPDEHAQVRTFLADKGIRLTNFIAAPPLDAFKAGMNPRWPGMLPASFLFDETGKLRYFWGGEAFESEIVPVVEGLLAGKPIDGEARFDLAPEGANKASSKQNTRAR